MIITMAFSPQIYWRFKIMGCRSRFSTNAYMLIMFHMMKDLLRELRRCTGFGSRSLVTLRRIELFPSFEWQFDSSHAS